MSEVLLITVADLSSAARCTAQTIEAKRKIDLR